MHINLGQLFEFISNLKKTPLQNLSMDFFWLLPVNFLLSTSLGLRFNSSMSRKALREFKTIPRLQRPCERRDHLHTSASNNLLPKYSTWENKNDWFG